MSTDNATVYKNVSTHQVSISSLRYKAGTKTVPVSFGPGETMDLGALGFAEEVLAVDKQLLQLKQDGFLVSATAVVEVAAAPTVPEVQKDGGEGNQTDENVDPVVPSTEPDGNTTQETTESTEEVTPVQTSRRRRGQ